jgi:flagellar hook-length control protein FliK
MTERSGKENRPPPELTATIERILDRVVISRENHKFVSLSQAGSNSKFYDRISKEKLSDKGKILDNESLLSDLKYNEKSEESNKLLSNLNAKNEIINNNGLEDKEFSYQAKKNGLLSNSVNGRGLNNEAEKKSHVVKSEARTIEMPLRTVLSTFSETINSVEGKDKALRGQLPTYLIDQVGKQISRSILRGDRIVRLQLKPPELGRVKIKIDIKDNTLKLGMIAEHSSVKELLLSNVHELREALVSQVVKLESVDIQINYGFDQSLSDSKEGLNQGRKWNQDSNGERLVSKDNPEESQSVPLRMLMENSLLDLVA